MSNPYDHATVGTGESHERFSQAARQMQVICAALTMGCIVFGMLALFLKGISSEIYENASIVTWLAVGFGGLALVQSFVIPMMIGRKTSGSIEGWLGIFRTKMIVGAALCESAAFFNIVVYIVETQLISLGVALFMLVRLVTFMPTAGGLESWVSNRIRTVEQGF